MKRLFNHFPAFTRRLWFQLAASYTVLGFCAMTVLIVTLYVINDYRDFRSAITPANVMAQLAGERLTLLEAITAPDGTQWREQARQVIREKLTNIETGNGASVYHITNSSRPAVYFQIDAADGRVILAEPARLPADMAPLFNAQKKHAAGDGAVWLGDGGPIWVNMPIRDVTGEVAGRLHVLYVADFDPWVQLHSIGLFLSSAIGAVLLLSIPIGLACGLVAARYVTRQLGRMNQVTESWRQGQFQARIALPNDDVLIRHSQHLNDMAQDLELHLRMKQVVAVSDERNRVARELHDTVKQKLFALGLQLATAKAKPGVMAVAGDPLREAEAINREAQHDLMEIITQLRPAVGQDDAFHERIALITGDFQRRFEVLIDLTHTGTIQANAQVEHQVLRILQEALINAVRHGRASRINVATTGGPGIALVTIVDNGTGFETKQRTDGFGIVSMHDRARDLPDGRLQIDSSIGAGTRIRISWKGES